MNQRILFVDDEGKILDSFMKSYKNDFHITISPSPKDAIELLRADNSFAVIVSDYRMNEMNGIEFLKVAKQISP